MTTKFGLDAPKIIYLNLVFSALLFLLELFIPHNLKLIHYWLILSIFFCLFVSSYMFYSSYHGKFKVVNVILNNLKLTGTEALLDVGCGRGSFLLTAAPYLPLGSLTGIDIWRQNDLSGNHIEVIQKHIQSSARQNIHILTMDMRKLDFPDATFDIVVSNLAIHNLSNKLERRKALLEMLRVLKPNGKLIILDFMHLQEYVPILEIIGIKNICISRPYFSMFPFPRVLMAGSR